MKDRIRVAIFASGSGSNAQNIFDYFKDNARIEIVSIYCNNPNAYVIERAKSLHLKTRVFSRESFLDGTVLNLLTEENIDFIVLAGFLWLVPATFVKAFPDRIINIHPAILPNFGGKGMYGMKVHEAVKNAGVQETGITIHYVNEKYDEGNVIFQVKTRVDITDLPHDIAHKVHELEYKFYPKIIEETIFKIFDE